ncbi:hypothetical protein V6N11_000755 [Hibiscus sabdariffa]|uniref:Uncharacterized protein n=1 Tax=Hibiscus sabdariffa TaxID=183260 RepID=A0ABR2RY93_9ROSI
MSRELSVEASRNDGRECSTGKLLRSGKKVDAATYYGFLNILMVKSASRNSETNGARNKYRKRKPVFRNP